MTREYVFAKELTEEQANEILAEGSELQRAQKIVIEDLKVMKVTCENGEAFESVMERLVNIVARLAGTELTFQRFIYEE